MRPMHGSLGASVAVAALATAVAVAATSAEIHLPDGDRPALLDHLGSLEGLTALAIGPGGERVAAALSPESDPRSATLRLYFSMGTEPETLRMGGTLRDLVFSPDGARLFGLLHKAAKKSLGETHLLEIDLERLKTRRAMRLPPSAAALDYWAGTDSLLVACRNEIRTIALPDLRSGPLYPVPGINTSVASIGGGSLTLVGQSGALVLVDLAHAPGLRDMPILEKVETELPIVALAVASDGRRGLARLSDDTLMEVEFSPLRARVSGSAAAVVASKALPSATGPPAARERAPNSAPAVSPADSTPAVISQAPPSSRPGSPTAVATADAPPPALPAAAPGRLRGRIVGPAAGDVVEVVVLGPNNILREATRVRPSADGTFSADELAPGRYRIQLDGGGARVLISEPAFQQVELDESGSVPAIEFTVLRSL